MRDGYASGGAGSGGDTLYVPNKSGTPFTVIYAERVGYGSGQDRLRVYLQRGTPPWPTNPL